MFFTFSGFAVPASFKRSDEGIPATQFLLTPLRESSGCRPAAVGLNEKCGSFGSQLRTEPGCLSRFSGSTFTIRSAAALALW
jgi:hypothetical protein